MKNIRKLFATSILTLVFAASALAGEQWTPGKDSGNPRYMNSPANSSGETGSASNALTEAVLLFCHNVLAVM